MNINLLPYAVFWGVLAIVVVFPHFLPEVGFEP